jgi:hypothetical protein
MATTTSSTTNTSIGRIMMLSLLSCISLLVVLYHNQYGGVTGFSMVSPRRMITTTVATTNTILRTASSGRRNSSTSSENTMIEPSPPLGNSHGTNSCFLPLQQLEQDTYMPRIIYIVNGIYPSPEMTMDRVKMTPSSEYAPALGQWTYTFPPPTLAIPTNEELPPASIALEGSNIVAACDDPIVVIAEHSALNIVLPPEITQPVDLLVLIDRSKTYFSERKFLLFAHGDDSTQSPVVHIAAFHTREEIPSNVIVLGHVEQVTIPWLPAMAPTKTGFLEADEYY